jgi:predicted RNase H-like HicB family nuclease
MGRMPRSSRVHRRREDANRVLQLIREAVEFHIETMREDGLAVPEPSSSAEYVEVALAWSCPAGHKRPLPHWATSLDGDALGKIASLSTAELDGEVIGEELEGDDGQDRADEIGDRRNGDSVS